MRKNVWLVRPMVVAVSSCFSMAPLWAASPTPTGPQVVNGAAQFQGLGTNNLKVTNSPNAIIHWQGFSIGAGAVTQFVQQSASSSVLNRVVGADISQIHGQLLSNGRVFLINPAGIVIGAGGVINTAGFVGSTLQMQDADFLAGKLKFQGEGNPGSIVNNGWIRAGSGGNVVLVAPNIQNNGLIQTEGGQLVLAAGQKMTIGSLELEGVQFEIQAPADSVLNVGQLLANGGAVGVFAGTLKHSGDIRANTLVRDEAGRVVLKAQGDVTVAAGSAISASGKAGGDILVQSGTGDTRVAGQVTATGSAGRGGDIKVLGERVSIDNALVDASGTGGGGQIRIGGDYQGGNAAIRNASRTFIGPNAVLRADATDAGNGGRIIVWGDKTTQYYGSLGVRGGPNGGNGGFAEVSGKEHLVFAGKADLGAPKGAFGTLLLDPLDLYIADLGGAITSIIDEFADVAGNAVTISPATLQATPGDIVLQAGRYMRFNNNVNLTQAGQKLTATVEAWTPTDPRGTPPNRMDIAANITTAGGEVKLTAPIIQSVNTPTISTVGSGAAGASITLRSDAAINTPQLSLNAGTGAIDLKAGLGTPSTGLISTNTLIGGSVDITAPGQITTNAVTTNGAVTMTSTGGSITVSDTMVTGGGDVTLKAQGGNSTVSTRAINAVSGAVDISALSAINTNFNFAAGTSNNLNPITTTNSVKLTTTGNTNFSGSTISAAVNGGGSVTASATSTANGAASVNIGSGTDLNATSVTALTGLCSNNPISCQGATVTLSATGSVNVGTVTASAVTSTNNNVSESVSITAGVNGAANAGGSIRRMSDASLVTAVDVTLATTQLTGGGIGSSAAPLNVNLERSLTFSPNGEFRVDLSGATMPNRLNVNVGVAAAGTTYTGLLQRPAGGLTLTASATDTTVTIDNPTLVGFSQRVFNSDPFIFLRTPNGALTIPSIVVPEGDTTVPQVGPPVITTAALPVSISSSGNLTVNAYTRTSTAASLAKTTAFQSDTGTVTLGTVNASKDSVTVFGPLGVTISPTSLTTTGNVSVTSTTGPIVAGKITSGGTVTVTSTSGDITVGEIDTSSGTGSVTLNITCVISDTCGTSPAIVGAANNSTAFEVHTAPTASISVTGRTIGTTGFTSPLDLQSGQITLTSLNEGGRIGFDTAALVADTPNLTINAAVDANPFVTPTTAGARFNVTTGTTALQNLLVKANPAITGGGVSHVTSESRTYDFAHNGAAMVFDPGTVPGTQFPGAGVLSLTTNQGDITVTTNVNMTPGKLALIAQGGNIDALAVTFDGSGQFDFAAGTLAPSARASSTIRTGTIGGTTPANTVNMIAGSPSNATGVVQTSGAINSTNVAITTHGGGIQIGATGTDNITGSVATGTIALNALPRSGTSAGAIQVGNIVGSSVSITSQETTGSVTSTIDTGNITAGSISIRNLENVTTTGNLDAVTSINIVSRNAVTTNSIDAPSVNIDRDLFLQPTPSIQVNGSLGAVRNVTSATLVGNPLTITGAVVGGNGATINLLTNGGSALTVAGFIVAGPASTINLLSRQGFDFSRIDAGSGASRVTINADGGPIVQTVAGGSNGITAQTVTLNAPGGTGFITNTGNGGTDPVDLFGTSSLSFSTPGRATFDMHGSTLAKLDATKGDVTTAPFTLTNLNPAQTIVMSTGGPDATLRVNSPLNTLDFRLAYNGGGITLANEGIVTNGGPATVSASGDFNGTVGGIRTGGPLGGGAVNVSARNVMTGRIDTSPTGTGTGGRIDVTGINNIIISDNLTTGTGGSGIGISTTGTGSITRSGTAFISSDSPSSVSVTTNDGDIGASGTPLLITSPAVILAARSTGRAFATLTGTNNLDLRGDEGFNVGSDTAFTALTVQTKGSGTGTPGAGTLNLTAPGQTYTFARPTVDNFGTALTNTFQVVTADLGAGATSATFGTVDGDLFIGGGANIIVPTLTLQTAFGAGDIKLQGNAGSALVLSNSNQTISSNRDVLITGKATISAGTTQSISANRDVTVQAQQGAAALTAPTQTISSNNGTIAFRGGAGTGDSVSVSASVRQLISTPDFSTSSISLEGGTGNNASVTVAFNGAVNAGLTGASAEQQIQAGGQVRILGGGVSGSGAFALVTGNQRQLVRARGVGVPTGEGSIHLAGGPGASASARIEATGSAALQQVAEGRCFFVTFSCSAEPYQTPTLMLRGGAGADSFAEVRGAGPQQIHPTSTLNLGGGSGSRTFARIENPSANSQNVGDGNNDPNNTIVMTGGSGQESFARIGAAGPQTIRAITSTTLRAGAGDRAKAQIESAVSQTLNVGNLTLTARPVTGVAGVDAFARINTTGTQNITFNALTMAAGDTTGSFVMIDAGSTQTFSGGNVTLTAGGTAAAPVGNAGAVIEGHNQAFCEFGTCGPISITGGGGTAGNASDARLTSLSGRQLIRANSIAINGGEQNSSAGVFNQGTGTQTLTITNGIAVTGHAVGANADALIQNTTASAQALTATLAGITVGNTGSGVAGITSAGTQTFTSRFVDVQTGAGSSGNSIVSSGGNQFIRTTNGTGAPASLRAAAIGSGTASIEAGGTQLLEVDYTELTTTVANPPGSIAIGDALGAGVSLIKAPNQSIFARTITVQGGSGAAATSKLTGTNTQVISVLDGPTNVFGGTGGGAAAGIDPVTQVIVANNSNGGNAITLTGAGGDAFIASGADQTIFATRGNVALTGAAGVAQIASATTQAITVAQDLRLESSGNGTVIVTSAGTQNIDARGLDVMTLASGPGGANATVFSAGDQTIHTRGALGTVAGVGMRVASLSTGVAKVESAGNQILNIDGNQLVVGALQAFPSAPLNPAAGDSHVLATSTTSDPNQTVTAGSVYIQGPSGDLKTSRLSGDGTQIITTTTGGITIIGGSGTDTFAIIDPTNQTITSFGDILLEGGTGPNADAIINSLGPQTVMSLTGNVTLIGGQGQGADAIISNALALVPQSVSGVNGPASLQQGAGGVAALRPGGNSSAAAQVAANRITNEVVRGQDELEEARDGAASREQEENNRFRGGVQLCN